MDETGFLRPGAVERWLNRFFGFLVGHGLGLAHNYLVIVRGRKSGKLYSTPVDVLDLGGRRFLVAPRGATEWVRNALAGGEVTLKKGRKAEVYAIAPLPDEEKPVILKTYLDRFRLTVRRYFPVAPGAPAEAFRPLAPRYPVFELKPKK